VLQNRTDHVLATQRKIGVASPLTSDKLPQSKLLGWIQEIPCVMR